MSFAATWRALRAEKWTVQNQGGLKSIAYVQPGKTVKDGVEGQDYFSGERALLLYVNSNVPLKGRLLRKGVNVPLVTPEEDLPSKRRRTQTLRMSVHGSPTKRTRRSSQAESDDEESTPSDQPMSAVGTDTPVPAAKAPKPKTVRAPRKKMARPPAANAEREETPAANQAPVSINQTTNADTVSRDSVSMNPVSIPATTVRVSIPTASEADSISTGRVDTAGGSARATLPRRRTTSELLDAVSQVLGTDSGEHNDGSESEYEQSDANEEEADEHVEEGESSGAETSSAFVADMCSPINFDEATPDDPNLVDGPDAANLSSDTEDNDVFEQDEAPSDALDRAEADEVDEDDDDDGVDDVELQAAIAGSSDIFNNVQLRIMAASGWTVLAPDTVAPVVNDPVLDKMYSGYTGPTPEALNASKSLLSLFYFFLPKTFWLHVASESNRYWRQTLQARIDAAYERQKDQENARTRERIAAKLKKAQPILPHEIVQWIGLLVARVLQPRKQMSAHWSRAERGVLSRGTFGDVMSRERFMFISAFLHFSDNESELAKKDRAWKIRPIIQTLEKTFMAGYTLGRNIAIDEGMLPSRSRHNPTRTYMKDKPHKWGSKCVMTCDADSGYCKRVELDVGKKAHLDDGKASDTKSGPAAVIRNLSIIFRGQKFEGRRLVVTDRFYSSVPLAQQLRTMGFNFCGTIQKNRLGWCKGVEFATKTRKKGMPRGEFKMAIAKSNPGLVALGWMDNRPVYFTHLKWKPRAYQTHMGGVDKHDQLRLQSYSLQLSNRFVKYYKSLFLGFVDMALVNAFIIHAWARKNRRQKPYTHYEFLEELHGALIAQTEVSFARNSTRVAATAFVSSAVMSRDHVLTQTTDTRVNNGITRLRQRQCKVCSHFKGDKKRGGTTTFFCSACSEGKKGLVFLCNVNREHSAFPGLTCSQIFHVMWKNGEFAPTNMTSRDRALQKTNE